MVYVMSRDSTIFPDADEFKPERWMREEGKTTHNFASLPFGFGARGCIGRRVAELEMYLLIARVRIECSG